VTQAGADQPADPTGGAGIGHASTLCRHTDASTRGNSARRPASHPARPHPDPDSRARKPRLARWWAPHPRESRSRCTRVAASGRGAT
jgi:hypothetical protein